LDIELVYLKVPDNLTHWISTSDGLKLIEKVKSKKSLIDLEIIQEDGTASLKLIGLKNNIDSASLFLKFNFDNLDHVGKLKIRKNEMQTDLKKKEEFYSNQYKVDFEIPGEIVKIVVGTNYNKIKGLQEKFGVHINVGEWDQSSLNVTIKVHGISKENVDKVVKILHVKKNTINLDKKEVSFLIGKGGDRIKTIIENSKLLKIDFDNGTVTEKVCVMFGNDNAIELGKY